MYAAAGLRHVPPADPTSGYVAWYLDVRGTLSNPRSVRGSELDPHRTGIGMYAAAVLRHVPAADPTSRYVAWYLDVRGTLSNRRWFRGWAPNLSERATRVPTRAFAPVTVRTNVPRLEWLAGRFDVALATNFLPPPTRSRGVVLVVHDLAFDHHPETAPHHNARDRKSVV